MLYRFGLLIGRHARLVLVLGALLFIGSAVVGAGAFGQLSSGGFDDPSAESTLANQLTAEHFGPAPNLIMVGTADDGDVTSAASTAAGEAADREPGRRAGCHGRWPPTGRTPVPQLKSTDGSSAIDPAVIAGDQGTMVTRGAESDRHLRRRERRHNGLTVLLRRAGRGLRRHQHPGHEVAGARGSPSPSR